MYVTRAIVYMLGRVEGRILLLAIPSSVIRSFMKYRATLGNEFKMPP